jgi:hypothetical protein
MTMMKKTMLLLIMFIVFSSLAVAQLPMEMSLLDFSRLTDEQVRNEMSASLSGIEVSTAGITYVFDTTTFTRRGDAVSITQVPSIRVLIPRKSITKCLLTASVQGCVNTLVGNAAATIQDTSVVGQVKKRLQWNYERALRLRNSIASEVTDLNYNAFVISSQASVSVIDMRTTTTTSTTTLPVTTTTKKPTTTTTLSGTTG